ncbi:MAG TPA: hypothetical protein VLE03_02270 [Nitrospiraceae bacterium]|nr:hypothetical protein [Nitrospiraceae bacterium]
MGNRLARRARQSVALALVLCASVGFSGSRAYGGDSFPVRAEFSGTIIKQVNGKRHQAQVFAKGDRLRLEYKYAIRTEHGYAAIEIIRLDQLETWYVLAQQKELLVTPLNPDDVLPIRAPLPGERDRLLVGEATAAGRPAQLFEVGTDRNGRAERFFEWVDVETGVVLKLVSRDRDWSVEYERFRLSPQPDYYFEAPPGYKKRVSSTGPRQQG